MVPRQITEKRNVCILATRSIIPVAQTDIPEPAPVTGEIPAPITDAPSGKNCDGKSGFGKFACNTWHGLKELFGREVADSLMEEWQGM